MATLSSTLSPEGRIVIPASIRKALSLQAGDTVTFRLEGDHAVIIPRSAAVTELQAMFATIETRVLLSDELIAERRAEAAREVSGE